MADLCRDCTDLAELHTPAILGPHDLLVRWQHQVFEHNEYPPGDVVDEARSQN